MNTSENPLTEQKPQPEKRRLHPVALSALTMVAPPLAHRFHKRYIDKLHLLFWDSVLAIVMLVLIGINIVLLASNGLQASRISGSITMPAETQSAVPVTVTFAVEAKQKSLQYLTLQLVPPDGTVILSADTPIESNQMMYIDRIEKGSTHTITAEVMFLKPVGTEMTLRAIVEYYGPFDTALHEVLSATTTITSSPVAIEIDSPSSIVSDSLTTSSVTVRNTSTETLQDLSLQIETDDAYTLTSADPEVTDDILAWDIAELAPQASATFTTRGTFRTPTPRDATTRATLSMLLFGETYTVHEASQTFRVAVPLPDTPAQEEDVVEAEFTASAHYYSTAGIQFGSGPLPPRLSQTTTYRVFWRLTAEEALANAVVTATLPPFSEWAANVSVSDGSPIAYDAATRSLRWPIGAVMAGTAISASFDISLTPSEEQVGTAPVLLSSSILTADAKGATETWRTAILTTAISDPLASGTSIVIR